MANRNSGYRRPGGNPAPGSPVNNGKNTGGSGTNLLKKLRGSASIIALCVLGGAIFFHHALKEGTKELYHDRGGKFAATEFSNGSGAQLIDKAILTGKHAVGDIADTANGILNFVAGVDENQKEIPVCVPIEYVPYFNNASAGDNIQVYNQRVWSQTSRLARMESRSDRRLKIYVKTPLEVPANAQSLIDVWESHSSMASMKCGEDEGHQGRIYAQYYVTKDQEPQLKAPQLN
jgi:hypothetical protein